MKLQYKVLIRIIVVNDEISYLFENLDYIIVNGGFVWIPRR